jgi:hypothetical protein
MLQHMAPQVLQAGQQYRTLPKLSRPLSCCAIMTRILAAPLICLLLLASRVAGHGHLIVPPSRNFRLASSNAVAGTTLAWTPQVSLWCD